MKIKDLNLDKYTLEDLAKLQKDIAIKLEERITQEVKQSSATAEQLKMLAQSILGDSKLKSPRKTKEPTSDSEQATESSAWEQAKETLPAGVHWRHPEDEKRTWNGRGKQPKWVKDAIKEGRDEADLKITAEEAKKEPPKAEVPKEEAK